ncbi:major capsid protein [Gordonia sp. CPCC 206044]|uniref:major capsid protein n=1 Tax=Gordonia sp. CPCC 206044 TaxID=3140793 RepID=UPI003AF3D334
MTFSSLMPDLNGREITVDYALKNVSRTLGPQIAQLTESQLLLPRFFRPYGRPVEGGGLLYTTVNASDFYSSDVEERQPGAEFRVVEGVDPDPHLAKVRQWGGKFKITDEQIRRNDISYLDQQTTQLANTIARKLDNHAYQILDDSINAIIYSGEGWSKLVIDGPADSITPSSLRPPAHLSQAQLQADLEELAVIHDLMVVHPNEAHSLRSAYGDRLDDMLTSAGVRMVSNPRVTPGVVWVCAEQQVGTVGFEDPLTVEVYDDRATRSRWVQGFASPALALDRPYAAKKIHLLDDMFPPENP